MHCAFCQRVMPAKSRTREHALAEWILKFVPGPPGAEFTQTVVSGETGEVLRRFSADKLEIVTKKVCDTCNNGWMSQLESKVKPFLASILNGHGRTFHTTGLTTMAAWAVKSALAFDQVNRDAYEPIPPTYYRAMASASDHPPKGVQVFLSAYQGPVFFDQQMRRLEMSDQSDTQVGDAYLQTFRLGPAVFQVFFYDYPEELSYQRPPGWDGYVEQIWPITGPVTWPPRRILHDRLWIDFKDGLVARPESARHRPR